MKADFLEQMAANSRVRAEEALTRAGTIEAAARVASPPAPLVITPGRFELIAE